MRRINSQDGIVPEHLFDYCGYQHTVNHMQSYLFASKFAEAADILDTGCGSGYGTELLASHAGQGTVVGIDLSSDAIRYCCLRRKSANLHFVRMDSCCLSFSDESFDLVTSFEVIEHIADYPRFLAEVRRVLRPGGHFALATPNAVWRRLHGIMNPHHIKEFTYEELHSVLRRYFDDVRILYRHFWTHKAEEIRRRVIQAAECYRGVRLLTERSRRTRLIHLLLPYALLDLYFRWRTGYPIHWYGPQHVRLEEVYSDKAYAFLITAVKP